MTAAIQRAREFLETEEPSPFYDWTVGRIEQVLASQMVILVYLLIGAGLGWAINLLRPGTLDPGEILLIAFAMMVASVVLAHHDDIKSMVERLHQRDQLRDEALLKKYRTLYNLLKHHEGERD